ncbi:MAG: hypothetical protein AAF039_08290 [Bacteroidota bacterium]
MASLTRFFGVIRGWTIFVVFVFTSFGFAQGVFKKGSIIDSVAVVETKDESFALYLPHSFETSRAYPIIFVFDPAARGRMGLLPFVESSEKYGIILVCANNSKNGSFERNFGVANNLFNHIFRNYKIDAAQMYLSGFSGGSRLATAIAVLSGQFAGVIACGAGFSPNLSQTPSPLTEKFLYAGICGVEDMNYAEMVSNKGYLKKLKFQNTLFSFDGSHRWPDKKEITRAVDWLFLQKRKNGNTKSSKDLITDLFLRDQQVVKLFLEDNELLFAHENYERILHAYPLSMGLDSIRSKHLALVSSRPFKLESKRFSEALKLEEKMKKKLFGRLRSDLSKEQMSFNWWEKEVEKLNQLETKGHKEIKRMISRVRYSIIAAVYEKNYSSPLLEKNKGYHAHLIKKFRQLLYNTE